ncbi:hypothetical protein Hte_003605 [Hypoxylon texense]
MIANSLKERSYEQTYSDGDMYPARFIEVGGQGALSCRLVETHSRLEFTQSSLVPYAALSYCWGSKEDAATQFKTERFSLEDRLNGFQMNQVTPILHDAILTTRALKIPYLWVDTVCIIQDDDEDWDKESSRMILVYQNAALTICTPASASCQQGVLARDWNMTRIKFQSKIDETVSGSYTLRFVSEVPARVCTSFDGLTFALLSSSWSNRGWVIQEFQLSQRTLVFDKTKLHILTANYIQSEGSEPERSMERVGRFRIQSYINTSPSWYLFWLEVVQLYSRCELSYLSDKLPAISALARHILPSSLPFYYAGHIFLHIDLFWVLKKWTQPQCFKTQDALIQSLQFQGPYVAPSWSWASRSDAVGFDNRSFFDISKYRMFWCNFKEECEFVKVSISLAGRDLFGKVKDGSLVIRGAVVPLSPRLELLGDIAVHEERWKMIENDKYVAYLSFDWDKFEDEESFEKLSLVLLGSCKARAKHPWQPMYGIHEVEVDGGLSYSLSGYEGEAELDDELQGSSAEGEGEQADITENDLAYEADGECAIHVGERGQTVEEDDQNHDRSKQGSGISSKEDVPDTSGTRHSKAYVYPLITPDGSGEWAEVTILQAKPGGERHAYGIVIHPASTPGKYLRVGVFYSVPVESGGLKYFQNRPTQTVEII